MQQSFEDGLHIIGRFLYCEKEPLINFSSFINELLDKIKLSGMTPEKYQYVYFGEISNSPYSLDILLSESHVNIHTFSEENEKMRVAVSIYTCNYTKDNDDSCRAIYNYLQSVFKPKIIDKEYFINL